MTEETQEAALERIRPLGATQNRNLVKIIEVDFASLRTQVIEFAAEQVAAKKQELRMASSKAQQELVEDQAHKLINKYMDKRKKLMRQAEEWGITLGMPSMSPESASTSNAKLANDLKNAEADINRDRDTAIAEMMKAELAAKRKVYEASVSKDAETVLNSLPSAQQALTRAAELRAGGQA